MLVHLVRPSGRRVVVGVPESCEAPANTACSGEIAHSGHRSNICACVCCADERAAADQHHVSGDTGLPPAGPPHVGRRGSRAGFDYEDIDDLRIAVSELCSLISGAPSGDITLRFQIEDGVVEVEGHASQGTLVENEFSRMIVDAVVDDLELQSDGDATTFRCTKHSSTTA